MKTMLLLCICFSMVACGNGPEEEDKVYVDTSKVTRDIRLFEDEEISWILGLTGRFITEDNLKLEEEKIDSFMVQPFSEGKSFVETYAPLLRWSPDSSKILDLNTYGNIANKNSDGNVVFEAGDPDSEVAYIDISTRKRYRLFWSGPSGRVLGGRWLNNSSLSFVTSFDDVDSTVTNVWIVDVANRLVRKYEVEPTYR